MGMNNLLTLTHQSVMSRGKPDPTGLEECFSLTNGCTDTVPFIIKIGGQVVDIITNSEGSPSFSFLALDQSFELFIFQLLLQAADSVQAVKDSVS
jgi:hypothetical protein